MSYTFKYNENDIVIYPDFKGKVKIIIKKCCISNNNFPYYDAEDIYKQPISTAAELLDKYSIIDPVSLRKEKLKKLEECQKYL